MTTTQQETKIATILSKTKTIAVVGLSDKADRPSYHVAAEMQRRGYKIVPVNPAVESVLGESSFGSLREIPFPIELVNVFRAAEFVPAIVDDMLAIGAPYLWLQEGVVHTEATAKAEANGVVVVSDLCVYKEHARWSAGHGKA